MSVEQNTRKYKEIRETQVGYGKEPSVLDDKWKELRVLKGGKMGGMVMRTRR